jgi:uncharacterized protein (TIGR03382 family)
MSTTELGVRVIAGHPTLDFVELHAASSGVQVTQASLTLSHAFVAAGNSSVEYQGVAGSQLTISNSVLVNASDFGVYAVGPVTGTSSLVLQNDTLVGTSTCVGCGHFGTGVGASGAGLQTLVRNTIVARWKVGVFAGSSAPVTLDAVDVWNNDTDLMSMSAVDPTCTSNCLSQNPNFVNIAGSAAADFELTTGSVCIDSGGATGAPTDDYLGHARPFDGDGLNGPAFDIGAFEYGSVAAGTGGGSATGGGTATGGGGAATGGGSATGGGASTGGGSATGGGSGTGGGGSSMSGGCSCATIDAPMMALFGLAMQLRRRRG